MMVYLVLDSLGQLIINSLRHVVIAPVHLNSHFFNKDLEILNIFFEIIFKILLCKSS